MIQKVPSSFSRPREFTDTTCRHSECPNKVTPPGSYRASLERLRDCGPGSSHIGYEAIESLSNVLRTRKGFQGRRGLGANGQEWWCLKCLEALLVDLRERVLKHSTRLVHPLTTIQYWIVPERRTIPRFDGIYYTLQSHQIYLLAKWQAVKTFDQLRDRPAEGQFDLPEEPVDGVINLYLGHDEESFYMNRAARDMRGVLRDQRVCEIDARDVRGYSLSEAFRRLDKKEDKMVEEKWKPVMAERKKKAKSELEEEEDEYVEEKYMGGIEEQGDESRPIELETRATSQPHNSRQEEESEPVEEKRTKSTPRFFKQEEEGKPIQRNEVPNFLPPGLKQDRGSISVVYVGIDLPETSRKRKRGDSDQNQMPPKRSLFTPKTSKAAPERLSGTAEEVIEGSSVVAHAPSSPLRSIARSSSKIKYSNPPTSKKGDRVPVIKNANRGPLPFGPTSGAARFLPRAVLPSRPLKFAPKRTSRLCKRKISTPNDKQVDEQEKEHTVHGYITS